MPLFSAWLGGPGCCFMRGVWFRFEALVVCLYGVLFMCRPGCLCVVGFVSERECPFLCLGI